MIEQLSVACGRRVVEFVHDDVVETVPREALKMRLPAKCLDGTVDDFSFANFLCARVLPQHGVRADCAKSAHRLFEDLLTMGDEENPLRVGLLRIERGQPCFAESGRE